MEYLDSKEWITLNKFNLQKYKYSDRLYQRYLDKICILINILHENNIAHRDLHSNNIMVNIKHQYSDNNVMIIDYDDAKTIKKGEDPWSVEKSGFGGGYGQFGELCTKTTTKYRIKYYLN